MTFLPAFQRPFKVVNLKLVPFSICWPFLGSRLPDWERVITFANELRVCSNLVTKSKSDCCETLLDWVKLLLSTVNFFASSMLGFEGSIVSTSNNLLWISWVRFVSLEMFLLSIFCLLSDLDSLGVSILSSICLTDFELENLTFCLLWFEDCVPTIGEDFSFSSFVFSSLVTGELSSIFL